MRLLTQFNVLTEPWLTAVTPDGREHEYGLLDLLSNAHELESIVDPSPPIQFGMYRLLIAFVQHALQLAEFEDLEDVLEQARFDRAVFERYAEKIGWHRFDLFDANRPFMQTPQIPGDADRPKSVVELFYHLPTGTNVIHFFHMEETEHAVAPAVAARALCSIAPFMTSGGPGYSPSINGTPPWYVLALGENLFETILLNCCVMHIGGLNHEAPPAWASDESFTPKAEKSAESLVQGLTWQPRQVRLLPSEGGVCSYTGGQSSVLVRQVAWGPGYKFAGHATWVDPNVAYQLDEKRGPIPVRPREHRQLWRDYGPLFLSRDNQKGSDKFARPAIVSQLSRLKAEGFVPADTAEQFEVYGMRVDKAKVFEWQYERMPLRTGILQNPVADVQVRHALNLAEDVARGLYGALKRLHPHEGGKNAKALDGLIQRTQQQFWTNLERVFETEYLPSLERQSPGDEDARKELLENWKKALRTVGWRCVRDASETIDTGAEALRRQVEARNAFARTLGAVLDGALKARAGRKG